MAAPPDTWLARPRVAIIGSRGVSPYGAQVTEQFARQLAERGICIVSGQAIGVDTIAHTAAIMAGGQHIAVLGNNLDKTYPASNTNLARQLLGAGGTIISEYPENTPSFKQHFIARSQLTRTTSRSP